MSTTDYLGRRELMNRIGLSYGGKRDLYEALGYPSTITYDDYYQRYRRQDIATRVIDAPVTDAWCDMPQILESNEGNDTKFEQQIINTIIGKQVFSKLIRLDKLSRIGQYAVLLFGFDGIENDLSKPIKKANKLLYITPYGEGDAEISSYDDILASERYGYPETYRITTRKVGANINSTQQLNVHHSRILHVCENNLLDDIMGIPSLENVFNRLLDLEKIIGGSSEMFWQGAFPGWALEAEAGTNVIQNSDAIQEQLDKYVHKMQRYMKLQGVKVNQLSPQVVSPVDHIESQLKFISAATNIPKRILLGSERGQLASGQDADNWNNFLFQRRKSHIDPKIIRPFIDKLISMGVVSPPKGNFEIIWPSLYVKNDLEQADIALKLSTSLEKYVTSGLNMEMNFKSFLTCVCNFDENVVQLIVASGQDKINTIIDEENFT